MLVQWGCSSQTSPFFLTIFPQYTYVFILLLVKELDWFAFHIWRGFPLLINCQLLGNVRLKQKILQLSRHTSPLPWMWTRLRDMYHSDLSRQFQLQSWSWIFESFKNLVVSFQFWVFWIKNPVWRNRICQGNKFILERRTEKHGFPYPCYYSQDLISNSSYCLPYSSCDVSLENLGWNQLIIP